MGVAGGSHCSAASAGRVVRHPTRSSSGFSGGSAVAPAHRMVISKIWLSLLCSSVACNTDTAAVLVQRITNTPSAVTGAGGGWPGKSQSHVVTVRLSPAERPQGLRVPQPRLTRAPQWAAISSNGAF